MLFFLKMSSNNRRNGGRGGYRRSSNRGSYNRSRSSNRNSRSNTSSNTNTTKKEMKFMPQAHGKQQSHTFATVKEHAIQHIQRTFEYGHDMAKSLADEQLIDINSLKPTRAISTKTKEDEKKLDQDGLDIEYAELLRAWIDRDKALTTNITKAYSLLLTNYCTTTMQRRLEEHPDWTSIQDDPIALLKAIRSLVHEPIRANYPFSTMTEQLARLLNLRQMEAENLGDYIKRFKQEADVVKASLGKRCLDQFAMNTEYYKAAASTAEEDNLKNTAFEAWLSYQLV